MRGCLSESEIQAMADGRTAFAEGDQRAIESHLKTCATCRGRLARAAGGHSANPAQPASTLDPPPPPPESKSTSSSPLLIEGYEVLERVQSGSQGVVYKAIQRSTNRLVALKILPHEETASERRKHRFEREVSLAANLRHPNIVTIYDSGLASGRYFFAMEYVHGLPLDAHARVNDLDVRGRLALFVKVCDAVAHAHQQNVVHRDLKPGNVLVDARGEPRVLDFGLAKTAGGAVLGDQQPVTATSQFMGTLAYAAPEQTLGDPALVDRRSDVYALGVMLFQLLTGAFPYPLPADLLGQFNVIRNSPPRRPSELAPEVDRDLDTIVLRALSKEPARRYQSAEEFANDLHRYLAGEPISARRDSVGYMLASRAKASVRRHRVLTAVAIIALTIIASSFLAQWISGVWPAPARLYEYAVAGGAKDAGSSVAGSAFENVRVVAVTNQTVATIEALARQLNVSDVRADHWPSTRRLHGFLMKRLAQARARAVVWDFGFIDADDADSAFVEGVRALQDANIGVVVGLYTWTLDERGVPLELSPAILKTGALWGGGTLGEDDLSMWKIDLVMQHPDSEPMFSLCLAAWCAWMYPNADPRVHFDRDRSQAIVEFHDRHGDVAQVTRARATIPLTAVGVPATFTDEDKDLGVRKDSLIGLYAVIVPPDDILNAATLPYEDVIQMSDADLERWAGGRLILIGDDRQDEDGEGDRGVTPDKREVWKTHALASTIDTLIREVAPARLVSPPEYAAALGLAAIGGLVSMRQTRRSMWLRMVMIIIGLAGIVGLCLLTYGVSGVLLQPLGLLLSFIMAGAAWAWLEHVLGSRREQLPTWSTST